MLRSKFLACASFKGRPSIETKFPRAFKALAASQGKCSSGKESLSNAVEECKLYLSQSSIPARDLSLLAWSLDRIHVIDAEIWGSLIRQSSGANSCPSDYASTLFAISKAYQREPTVMSDESKNALRGSLDTSTQFLSVLSLCDSAQIAFALTSIYPETSQLSAPFVSRAVKLLSELPRTDKAVLKSCRELCLLWSVARKRKEQGQKVGRDLLEALCEASRGLRDCADFNQNKVAQVCESLAVLNLSDARPVYQVILFVDKHRGAINARNFLRIVRSMARLRVDNPVLWRRLGNILEGEIGLRFELAELAEISRVFEKLNPRNQRVQGILDLYVKTKQDFARYGV